MRWLFSPRGNPSLLFPLLPLLSRGDPALLHTLFPVNSSLPAVTSLLRATIATSVSLSPREFHIVRGEIERVLGASKEDRNRPVFYRQQLDFLAVCALSPELLKQEEIQTLPELFRIPPAVRRRDDFCPLGLAEIAGILGDKVPVESLDETPVETVCDLVATLAWETRGNHGETEKPSDETPWLLSLLKLPSPRGSLALQLLGETLWGFDSPRGAAALLAATSSYRVDSRGDGGLADRIAALTAWSRVTAAWSRGTQDSRGRRLDGVYAMFTQGFTLWGNEQAPPAGDAKPIRNPLPAGMVDALTHRCLCLLSEHNSQLRRLAAVSLHLLEDSTHTEFLDLVRQTFPRELTDPATYSETAILSAIFDHLADPRFSPDFCQGLVLLVGGVTPGVSDFAREKLAQLVVTENGRKFILPEFAGLLGKVRKNDGKLLPTLRTLLVCCEAGAEPPVTAKELQETAVRFASCHPVVTCVAEIAGFLSGWMPVGEVGQLAGTLLRSRFSDVRDGMLASLQVAAAMHENESEEWERLARMVEEKDVGTLAEELSRLCVVCCVVDPVVDYVIYLSAYCFYLIQPFVIAL